MTRKSAGLVTLQVDRTWMELTRDEKVLGLCASAFEALWGRAIPHAEYRPAE